MIIQSKRPFLFRPAATNFRRFFHFFKQNTDNINAVDYHLVNAVNHDQSLKIYITQTDIQYKRLLMSQSALNFKLLPGTLKNLTSNNHMEGQKNRCAPGIRCLVASNKQCTCLTFAFNHTTTCIHKVLENRTADLTRDSSHFEEDPRLALLLWNAL